MSSRQSCCKREFRLPNNWWLEHRILASGLGCALWAFLGTLAGQAGAAETDPNVRLFWQRGPSASSCPEQTEVEQLVRTRLGRDPFSTTATRSIDATIDLAAGAWHVELHVRDASGPAQGQRVFDVRADSCAQVADAVGLAVALAIDPNARITSLPLNATQSDSTNEPNSGKPSPGNTKGPGDDRSRGPQVTSTAPPPLPLAYGYTAQPNQAPLQPSVDPYGAQLTVHGLAAAGLLPGATPGFGVAGAIGKQVVQVTLGISYFPEAAHDRGVSFGLTTLDAGFCGLGVYSRSFIAGACAKAHAGAWHTVVDQLQPTKPGDRPYFALSLGPKVGWRAWAPFYIEAGLSAWANITRPPFGIVGEPTTFFQSRLVSAVGYLGVGWTTN